MTTAAHEPVFVIDVVYEPAVSHRSAAARSPKELAAARLQLIGRGRRRSAAGSPRREEDLLAQRPVGASGSLSEFFVDELAMVLGVGRGTAAHKAARAFTWRDNLPATLAALKRGEIDERRAQILADTLEHTNRALARRVEDVGLPEACGLTFSAL